MSAVGRLFGTVDAATERFYAVQSTIGLLATTLAGVVVGLVAGVGLTALGGEALPGALLRPVANVEALDSLATFGLFLLGASLGRAVGIVGWLWGAKPAVLETGPEELGNAVVQVAFGPILPLVAFGLVVLLGGPFPAVVTALVGVWLIFLVLGTASMGVRLVDPALSVPYRYVAPVGVTVVVAAVAGLALTGTRVPFRAYAVAGVYLAVVLWLVSAVPGFATSAYLDQLAPNDGVPGSDGSAGAGDGAPETPAERAAELREKVETFDEMRPDDYAVHVDFERRLDGLFDGDDPPDGRTSTDDDEGTTGAAAPTETLDELDTWLRAYSKHVDLRRGIEDAPELARTLVDHAHPSNFADADRASMVANALTVMLKANDGTVPSDFRERYEAAVADRDASPETTATVVEEYWTEKVADAVADQLGEE